METYDGIEIEGPLKWIVPALVLTEMSVCWAVFTTLWALLIGIANVFIIIGLVSLLPLHWRA